MKTGIPGNDHMLPYQGPLLNQLRVIPDSLIYLLVTVRAVPAESAPRGNKFARPTTSRDLHEEFDQLINSAVNVINRTFMWMYVFLPTAVR